MSKLKSDNIELDALAEEINQLDIVNSEMLFNDYQLNNMIQDFRAQYSNAKNVQAILQVIAFMVLVVAIIFALFFSVDISSLGGIGFLVIGIISVLGLFAKFNLDAKVKNLYSEIQRLAKKASSN